MHKLVPIFYSEYGRYLNRHRAIPINFDVLKPVERRLLLALYEVAPKKLVKSAKIIGHVLASYHPHGDLSTYGSLISLVKRNLAIGEGNWGSEGIVDDNAAAYRYTEVKSNRFIIDFAFKYIKYVEWKKIELEKEPLFLPAPIPIGLIGEGITTGISFDTTTIPRYNIKDLAKRLVWLQTNKVDPSTIDYTNNMDESNFGPCIVPKIKNCSVVPEDKNSFYEILFKGTGSLKIIPNGSIDKKKNIFITGKSPVRNGLKSLIKASDNKKINAAIEDLSKKDLNIMIEPNKPRSTDVNKLAQAVWKYISPNIKINCNLCNDPGFLDIYSIDHMLCFGYANWINAVLKQRVHVCMKIYKKLFENYVLQVVQDISNKINVQRRDDIIANYDANPVNTNIPCDEYDFKNNVWVVKQQQITRDNIIGVCNSKTITQLFDSRIDINKINTDIINAKQSVSNVYADCFTELQNLC